MAYVGRDAFVAGLRSYVREFAYGNTTLADLLGHLEATSGRDLRAWSAAWLQTAGPNTLRPVLDAVSYTHLDVYKRQGPTTSWPWACSAAMMTRTGPHARSIEAR